MNYQNCYYSFITAIKQLKRKKNDGVYYEEHHIIPRSLQGNNRKSNLVLLTPREHFLAHYLLYKFTHTKEALDSFYTFIKNPEYSEFIFSLKMYEEVIDKAMRYKFIRKNAYINNLGSKYDPIE
ncbi:MAG: HNH endonuclease [Elusimicrobiota bacterium]|jgi:hypothetical protein|nr:HNH endonuclease [Elusimicrobiota bacterium]